MIDNSIGKRIKHLRVSVGLTQQELASILKIGHSTLACYETDKRQVPYETLINLAKHFEVRTDYLLGLED